MTDFQKIGGEMNGSTSTSISTSSQREQSELKVEKHTEGRICTSQLAAFALCGFRTNFHKLIIDYPPGPTIKSGLFIINRILRDDH